MTRDELIEKVARALCWKSGNNPDLTLGGDGENFLWMEYENKATVAIDIVLEEAAMVAKVAWLDHHYAEIADSDLMLGLCEDIERRICALKGK